MVSRGEAQELLGFQKELLTTINEGRGFDGLAEVIAKGTGCSVIITNSLQRIVATWKVPYVISRGNALTVEEMENEVNNVRIVFEQQSWVASGFSIKGRGNALLGHLFLMEAEDKKQLTLGETGAEFCSLEFSRLQSIQEMEQRHRDNFIFDLLYSNFDSEETIVTWGQLWGWNLRGVHAVVVFALENYEESPQGKNVMKDLFKIGEESCRVNGLAKMMMQKREQLIVIITLAEKRKKANRKTISNFVHTFLKLAATHKPGAQIKVGIGRRYDSPADIFRSYQEAKTALELGKLITPKEGFPFFSNLGVARLLFNHDWQQLKDFYAETLGDLKEPELMETLVIYAKQGFDLKATAEILYLHPNSLRYRLKKIEEILEKELDDFETKIDVSIAMKIRSLLKLE